MPSWNIHTAHVERLLLGRTSESLGIADANTFLFGNYVPDIYVGFMVPDATFHVDYCLTHHAVPNTIPVPDSDRFWDTYVCTRWPIPPARRALTLGAWAHLVADGTYNGRFRSFCRENEVPSGEELRKGKQGDFDLFGSTLDISSHVQKTDELFKSARDFRPYSVLREDVERAVDVADGIVSAAGKAAVEGRYRLLDGGWMQDAFDACNERLTIWLEAWHQLEGAGKPCKSTDVRAYAGLPPAEADETTGAGSVAFTL